MMPPASAIAIRSSRLTGIHRERHRGLARRDQPLELGRAANAADEVDALVGANVADLQQRLRALRAAALRRRAHRRATSRRRRRQLERVPVRRPGTSTRVPRPVPAWLVPVAGPRSRAARSAATKRLGRLAGEIPDDAVVRQDADLIVGKRDRDERVGVVVRRRLPRCPARRAPSARAPRSRRDGGRRRCTAPARHERAATSASRSAPTTRQIVCCTPSGAVKS